MILPAKNRSVEDRLFDAAASCKSDPLRYVKMAYPWGEPDGPLAKHQGPDNFQVDVLQYIKENIGIGKPLRVAVAGGVGPGKSSLMSWVLDWGITTCVDCRARVTANTGPQLSTSTWPEITKWKRMSLFAGWFEVGDRRIRSLDKNHQDSWRLDAITWDEHTPEAFAGFHNAGKRIIYAFDEGAAVADSIYKESEGILAGAEDTEIIWLVMGNPSRTTGYFRTLFAGGSRSKLWKSWHIDTRTARMSDKAQIKEWIDYYGINNDFVRVRVLSQFPAAGSLQFIPSDLVERAASPERDPPVTLYDPLVMGVDVARFGDDKTVIRFRRGRDARSIPPVKLRGQDGIQVAGKVAELWRHHKPDAIFVDGGGEGASTVDHLRYLKIPFIDIKFGGAADRDPHGIGGSPLYANKRAEMWGTMKEWLKNDVMIDDDPELKAELTSVEYGHALKDGSDAIILERKADMKKRGLASPDDGDALALTFARPVGMSDHSYQFTPGKTQHEYSYDPCQSR